MSIRLQNLLAVVPIFVAVAVAGGWLRYSAEREEIRWGLQQEALALSTAVAAHLDGSRWEQLAAAKDSQLPVSLQQDFAKVIQGGKVRRLAAFGLDDQNKLYEQIVDPREVREIQPSAEVIRMVKQGEGYVSPLAVEDPAVNILNSFAPVHDASGALVGMIGMQTNADRYFARSREILKEASIRSILVCLFGYFVALAISSLVRGRIKELSSAAKKAAAGSTVGRVEPRGVQELRDLGNTFNTMVSVMGEVVQKTKNSLIENEQFRTERDLRDVYVESFYAPAWSGAGKYQVMGCLANDRCVGDFFEILEVGPRVISFVGRVAGDSVSQRMLNATAAHLYCREALPSCSPEEVVSRLKRMLPLQAWYAIAWETELEEIKEWSFDPETGELELRELESLMKTSFLHTLKPEAARRIADYVRCVPQVSPLELCTEVSQLLKSEREGALLIIGEK